MHSKLTVTRKVNAPIQQVFEAWSKPRIMVKWLYPPKAEWTAQAANQFKVDGHFRLDVLKKDGATWTHIGEYKEIVPNKKIVFTWDSDLVTHTLVTIELQELDHQTEILLTHDLFPNEESCLLHQIGWEGALENMDHYFLQEIPSAYSFRCAVQYDAPRENVYAAITTERGLQNWWTKECSVKSEVGSQSIFRFGRTYNIMKTIELIPYRKVVWECIHQHMAEPGLPESDHGEWGGTKLIFQFVKNAQQGTDLYFIHRGLTAQLNCFNHCCNRWGYYFQESLKNYLEKGVGMPFGNPIVES